MTNPDEHIGSLHKVRSGLVEARRRLAEGLGGPHVEGIADRIRTIQENIEAVDRAIADERELANQA